VLLLWLGVPGSRFLLARGGARAFHLVVFLASLLLGVQACTKTFSTAAGGISWECKRIGCDYWKHAVSVALSEKMAIEMCAYAC